jgi:hypothetical protein
MSLDEYWITFGLAFLGIVAFVISRYVRRVRERRHAIERLVGSISFAEPRRSIWPSR